MPEKYDRRPFSFSNEGFQSTFALAMKQPFSAREEMAARLDNRWMIDDARHDAQLISRLSTPHRAVDAWRGGRARALRAMMGIY